MRKEYRIENRKTKRCCRCKKRRKISQFFVRKSGRDAGQFTSWCRRCAGEYNDAWNVKNWNRLESERKAYRARRKEAAFNLNLKDRYGLSRDQYDRMVEAVGGCCQICGTNPYPARLCVDHNHSTGKIRGLICRGCNAGIGHFKENAEAMRDAANYVEEHS